MKKIVLKISIDDEKNKRKILKVIAGVEGVDSVVVDMKDEKVTVIGDTDPVFLASRVRKFGYVELLSVGPAKEAKVGSAKEEKQEAEKSHSEGKKAAGAPQIVSYPNDKYRSYEYNVTDEESSSCCIA